MRENRRYLLVDVDKELIEKAILDYIGILGFAKASPVFISKNIFSVNRQSMDGVKAGLLLAGIRVKKISGTIKGLSLL